LTCIIIPTWDNPEYLSRCLHSIATITDPDFPYRVVVIDNGSGPQTQEYLARFTSTPDCGLTVVRNEANDGFIRATNQGLAQLAPGEDALLLNDDTQAVDRHWLGKLSWNLTGDTAAVGPVSNFVMGPQRVDQSIYLPALHPARFLIGFCLLIRRSALDAIGGTLDTRFGLGGQDDLDLSIRLRLAGYQLLIDRSTFVFHYGAKSIERIGGYEKVEAETRPLLVEKWGASLVEELFHPLPL
jgi:GT2 family glycosyltransferase